MDSAVERLLSMTIANGMKPVGVLADENGDGQWIDCVAGLVRMPMVLQTSLGPIRYYRKPLPGESLESDND